MAVLATECLLHGCLLQASSVTHRSSGGSAHSLGTGTHVPIPSCTSSTFVFEVRAHNRSTGPFAAWRCSVARRHAMAQCEWTSCQYYPAWYGSRDCHL